MAPGTSGSTVKQPRPGMSRNKGKINRIQRAIMQTAPEENPASREHPSILRQEPEKILSDPGLLRSSGQTVVRIP
jgi:hypothetical protein